MSNEISVGSQFTKDKGTITILQILPVRKSEKDYIYEVECSCSVCSNDIEMYPNNFVMTKKAFKREYYPCGCASRPLYNEKQYLIMVKRKVSTKFGIEEVGEYKGSKTNIKLTCLIHRESFNSNYNKVMNGTNGCKSCIREEKKARYSLTHNDAEKRVRNKCMEMGYTFKHMDEYTVATKTHFTAICPNGNVYVGSYNNFVNNDHGCPCCSESSGGYNNKAPGWLYVVKWKNKDRSWIKVGITGNNPIDRFERQKMMGYKGSSELSYDVVLTLHFEDGKIPEMIEKKVKALPRGIDIDIQTMPDGYTECFSISSLEDIKKCIYTTED